MVRYSVKLRQNANILAKPDDAVVKPEIQL